MKQAIFLFVALSPLSAGVEIISESVNGNRQSQQKLLIDTDRMRADMSQVSGEGASVMFLTDGGRERLVLLDKAKNEYREIDQQTMNQMSQQMQGAMSQLNERMKSLSPQQRAMMEKMMKGQMPPGAGQVPRAEPVKYTAKGNSTVNGFACTMYEGMRGSEKVVEVCMAQPGQLKVSPSDLQVFEKLKTFTSTMTAGMGNYARGFDQFTDAGVSGFPVSRVAYSGGEVTHRSEVKSVKRTSFSGPEFSLGGAKKAEFMPGARPR